jgi:hypothetical protein
VGSDLKRSFLKRKSANLMENTSAKKGISTTAKKRYNYYADKFNKDEGAKPRKFECDDEASDDRVVGSRNHNKISRDKSDNSNSGVIEIFFNDPKKNLVNSDKKGLRRERSRSNHEDHTKSRKKEMEATGRVSKWANEMIAEAEEPVDTTRANKTPNKDAD